jgi:hypothetical protein
MSNKVEANNRQAPPPDRTRAEAMKRKLLLAAIALVSLSGFALADDIHSRAGTWDVVSAGKFVLAHSDSAIARSEDRARMMVRVGLQDGPAEATFDLNGIDEVRQTLDDVCKLNPARVVE